MNVDPGMLLHSNERSSQSHEAHVDGLNSPNRSVDADFFDRGHDFDAIPYRSIADIHLSYYAFKSKRAMEWFIYLDLLIIVCNFRYWVEFKSDQGQPDSLAAASKLEWLFILGFAPYVIVKTLFRFWANSKPNLQR